ncbi:MAG: hypothetical protein F7C34_01000 [Desulfurococcales archaeon]|nr:hypothetical protein [Desulfurococcales archaeon]
MRETKIVVGPGTAVDYAYRIVEFASKGVSRLKLYAVGESICKLADTIAILPEIYPGTVEIVGWSIGSKRVKGERKTFLSLTLELRPSG